VESVVKKIHYSYFVLTVLILLCAEEVVIHLRTGRGTWQFSRARGIVCQVAQGWQPMLGRSFQATVAARQSGSVPIRLYNVGSYIKEQIIVKLRKLVNLECKILVMDVKYW